MDDKLQLVKFGVMFYTHLPYSSKQEANLGEIAYYCKLDVVCMPLRAVLNADITGQVLPNNVVFAIIPHMVLKRTYIYFI